MKLRLDKYLADMGMGTRTGVKSIIKNGCVTCNGEIVKRPETKIEIGHDRVFCHGREIAYHGMEYYILYKPAGVLTATEDNRQRTVMDLLENSVRKDLFPVGRLDKDAEGLLLITNDGDLAHRLLSPGNHVEKRYIATVSGLMGEQEIRAFSNGMELMACGQGERFGAFHAMPAGLEILSLDKEKNLSQVEITIYEGKFHQVKRMCQAVGKPVVSLKRTAMGKFRLDSALKPGEYRSLTEEERNYVKEIKKE